ncbi:DUF1641 domain-containing protein [Roseiflexus sp.]|jgi:hypothetical protein
MKTLTSHTQRATAPSGNGHTSTPNGEGTTELLTLILDRLERMEQRFDHYEALVQQTLPMVGMMTDTVDGWMHELTRSGINIDERTKETLRLLAELTAPQSMETLHTLVEMLPTLGALVRQAPGAVAAMVDTGDELVMRLREAGIDIEHLGRRGLHAAKALIDSNVLEDAAVAVISNAAQSLEESACTARPTSLFGLIRAMGDPDVQRALGFFLAFAKSFGSRCKTSV